MHLFTLFFFENFIIFQKSLSKVTSKTISIRGQTVHWIGAQLYVSGFQRQVLKHVPKCKQTPLTQNQWIPRTNTCNVHFVGTMILLRIPQRASKSSCSGFRKCKRIPQIKSGIRKSMRIPLTICGIRLQFTEFAYNLRIPLTITIC